MTDQDRRIDRIEGRALPMRGDHIDTDRIMPARFLRAITFDGLEEHLFEDDRAAAASASTQHPFSDPAYRGAEVLLVNANFGCGSSREHAPQALHRWGIRVVVGESFSEIFFGNSVAVGMPCVTAGREAIETLMALAERTPDQKLIVSLADLYVDATGCRFPVQMPAAAQEAFLSGQWDATGQLLDRYGEVRAVGDRLPYVTGF